MVRYISLRGLNTQNHKNLEDNVYLRCPCCDNINYVSPAMMA